MLFYHLLISSAAATTLNSKTLGFLLDCTIENVEGLRDCLRVHEARLAVHAPEHQHLLDASVHIDSHAPEHLQHLQQLTSMALNVAIAANPDAVRTPVKSLAFLHECAVVHPAVSDSATHAIVTEDLAEEAQLKSLLQCDAVKNSVKHDMGQLQNLLDAHEDIPRKIVKLIIFKSAPEDKRALIPLWSVGIGSVNLGTLEKELEADKVNIDAELTKWTASQKDYEKRVLCNSHNHFEVFISGIKAEQAQIDQDIKMITAAMEDMTKTNPLKADAEGGVSAGEGTESVSTGSVNTEPVSTYSLN